MDNKTLTWQQRVWKWIGDFVYGIRPLLLYLLLPPAISAFGLFIAGLKEHIEFFLWRSGWAALLWLVYNVAQRPVLQDSGPDSCILSDAEEMQKAGSVHLG